MTKRSTMRQRTPSASPRSTSAVLWDAFWQGVSIESGARRARHIQWDELRETVRSREVVLLHVTMLDSPLEPDVVVSHFASFAATVWIELRTLPSSDASTRSWIESEIARLGRQWLLPLPMALPGYYLFARGELRAHDLGFPDVTQDPKALAAAFAWFVGTTRDAAALAQAGRLAAHLTAACRIIQALSSKLPPRERAGAHAEPRQEPPGGAPRQGSRQPPPAYAEPARDALAVAFEVLGLPMDAQHLAVKNRYRALAKEWHPDRRVGDQAREREAALRMQHINVAYAVICQARGWT
jgi:hypothetical protein